MILQLMCNSEHIQYMYLHCSQIYSSARERGEMTNSYNLNSSDFQIFGLLEIGCSII